MRQMGVKELPDVVVAIEVVDETSIVVVVVTEAEVECFAADLSISCRDDADFSFYSSFPPFV